MEVKSSDMSEEQQKRAIEAAKAALDQFTVLRDIAGHVKKEFDGAYGTTWHCVVGKSYGCYVTHQANSFVFFSIGELSFMLFKTA